jgi:urea transport system ATP-binding protein
MTVAENLMVGELVGGPRGKKQPDLVYQYFPRLAERRNQQAGTMSGGEQQQLAIGRALVGNPALMLLDEPSEGIQPSIVQLICDVLRAIRRDLGTTILFVEQNLDTILDVGERAYVMEKGRIVGRIEPGQMNAQAVRAHLML